MRKVNKKIAAVAAGAIVVSTAGAAYAYFSTSGSGSGQAQAGDAVALSVAQSGTIVGLVPGGTAVPVMVTVTNPASFSQSAANLTSAISTAADAYPAGCGAANWTFVPASPAIGVLAAGGSTTVQAGTVKLNETNANQDACKLGTIKFVHTANAS